MLRHHAVVGLTVALLFFFSDTAYCQSSSSKSKKKSRPAAAVTPTTQPNAAVENQTSPPTTTTTTTTPSSPPLAATGAASAPGIGFSQVDSTEIEILNRIHNDLWTCLHNARVFYKLKKEESKHALSVLKKYQVTKIITSPEYQLIVDQIKTGHENNLKRPYLEVNLMLAELFGYFGDPEKGRSFLKEIEKIVLIDSRSGPITMNQEELTIAAALEASYAQLQTMTQSTDRE